MILKIEWLTRSQNQNARPTPDGQWAGQLQCKEQFCCWHSISSTEKRLELVGRPFLIQVFKKLTCCGFCVILLNQAVCRDNERFMRPFKSQQKYSCMMEKICVHCLQFIQINLEHTISCGQILREDLNISRLSWLQNWYTQVSSPVQSQEGKSVRQRATNRPYPSTERCAKSELGTFTAFP